MKLGIYNEILHLMHTYKSRESLPLIAEKYPGVSLNALGSIFSQDYQKKMRKTHYLHYSPEAGSNYYERFVTGLKDGEKKILMKLSEQEFVILSSTFGEHLQPLQAVFENLKKHYLKLKPSKCEFFNKKLDLSPALLGRIVLERHLANTKYDGETPPKAVVTQFMREPSLIEEPAVAIEIQQCILVDDHYGPICDSIKHSIGHEYEFKLYRELNKLGLAYIGEEQMRAKGYDKTPDVKLEVPIAVDGHVVNWIESKASFGDEHSHKTYLKDQFWSYWNRFGPGMVIYWFAFIDELDVNQEKGIILRDCFPQNIVKMDPTVR